MSRKYAQNGLEGLFKELGVLSWDPGKLFTYMCITLKTVLKTRNNYIIELYKTNDVTCIYGMESLHKVKSCSIILSITNAWHI